MKELFLPKYCMRVKNVFERYISTALKDNIKIAYTEEEINGQKKMNV
ncbi:MAG: hypothetical protein CM15mP122_2700 [Bacteroidota bacterium]|nr:MAG: hypothetical protein CM15mP122_2700 [Bacteroidota bacterium]